ncbi:MAG: hypothetical protein LBH10_06435 [Burkholderiaceae bacterium]|jgi:hypothetical protein|nr:hypothetical protein [Burkholderiaceae bacterium]
MQQASRPVKIELPFANSGVRTTIPVPSQITITPGAASYTDGFPPLTMTPLSSGGIPPDGADFNGVLNAITAIEQWQCAGGLFAFDSTFCTTIGGYPMGALLAKADGSGFWVSTAENNMGNPDLNAPDWTGLVTEGELTALGINLSNLGNSVVHAGVTLTTASYQVTPADAGKLFYCTNPITLALPDATSCSGMVVGFMSGMPNANSVIINAAAGQYIYGDLQSITNLNLNGQNQCAILFSNGSAWLPIGGSPSALTNRIGASIDGASPNDFIFSNNEVLIQWGNAYLATGNNDTINYNIAFGMRCVAIYISCVDSPPKLVSANANVTASPANLTSFTASAATTSGNYTPANVHWLAIGF